MHRAKNIPRPKISTMPRQQSEAAALLDMHKLVVEKKRLQHELHSIEERQQQIIQRLAVIENHVARVEGQIRQMREHETTSPPSPQPNQPSQIAHGSSFDTMFLDY
ncbi:MAG: gas vesicle protein [Elainellaceae cyanobacterium]